MKRFQSRRKLAATVFAVIGFLLLLIQLGFWIRHPMFYNQFVMHDGLPFYHWWPETPIQDSRGNLAKADFHRNLLVVFLAGNSKITSSQFCFPRAVKNGVAFPSQLQGSSKIEFTVPSSTDRLFVFATDGARSDFPLETGEAECIYELMKQASQLSDLTLPLTRNYSAKHSPTCSTKLRETLTRNQAN